MSESGSWQCARNFKVRQSNLVRLGMLRLHMRARQPARLSEAERGAAVAGGSEIAGERLRRAAFGPEIPVGKVTYLYSLF